MHEFNYKCVNMNVKLKVLTAGVLFFTGTGVALAQQQQQKEQQTENKVTDIQEVVVVGYQTRKSTEVTGNAVQLKSSDINSPVALSVDQALQGKAAGVQINASSGTPGAVQGMRIRGVGSMTASNDPLIVVDGVPVISGNISGSSAVSTLSYLSTINNQDIESLTVLKDAAATAAYGARGSNGVIVITTKKGKKGKAQFNLSSNIGFQNDAFVKIRPLTATEKFELMVEGRANQFGVSKEEALASLRQLNSNNINRWDGSNYNWTDLLTNKDAPIYSIDLSSSAGDDKSTFYSSIGYNKTDGTGPGINFERISGMMRYTRKLTERLNLESSVNGTWIQQGASLEGGSYFGNPNLAKYMVSPFVNPFGADGKPNIDPLLYSGFTSVQNILHTIPNDITRNTTIRGLSNTKLDYKFLPNLVYTSRVSLDFRLQNYKQYRNKYHGDGMNSGGYVDVTNTTGFNMVTQNSLNYNFRLADKHKFDVTVLHEYQKNTTEFLEGYGEGFAVDGLTNLNSSSSNYEAFGSLTDWYNISYLGMLNYNFDNKLILDGTIRREGSSRFAPDNRFGTFWSVGAAYNLHKHISAFDELKLRGSYGLTGNSGVSINQYQSLLSYSSSYASQGGALPSVFGNQDLTWEKNNTLDVGIDYAILDRRVSGTFAYYKKKTYDLLLSVPLSRTTGFSSQARNIGKMENSGVEASISIDVIRSNDFNWSVSANIGTVKNKVTDLPKDGTGQYINPSGTSSYKSTVIGEAYSSWYMRTWAGVNTETGAPEWYLNGVDGERTSNYNAAARVFQGTYIPKYTGGISTNISYKNIFVDANVNFAGGHKVYEQYAQFYMNTGSTFRTYNGLDTLLDRWQKPGDVTDVPKMNFTTADNFSATSSRHLYDGTYARLKDLTVGYNLSNQFFNELGINGLTFTVRGTNLWTWVKDKGLKLDPETPIDSYTSFTTPPVKSFVFGVNIKF